MPIKYSSIQDSIDTPPKPQNKLTVQVIEDSIGVTLYNPTKSVFAPVVNQ